MANTKFGSAVWEGGIKSGGGHVSTESGVLHNAPYGFNTRFEGKKGSNPEELVGAAHASCFAMATALMLEQAGHPVQLTGLRTEHQALLDLGRDGGHVGAAGQFGFKNGHNLAHGWCATDALCGNIGQGLADGSVEFLI